MDEVDESEQYGAYRPGYQLIHYQDDNTLWTPGGKYMMTGTLTECGEAFLDVVILSVDD